MKRVISSGWTIPFKFVLPLFFTTVSIYAIARLLTRPSGPSSDALIFVSLLVAATLFLSWWGAKLKIVSLDDENLYVSNSIKEITIPLTEIAYVYDFQSGWPVIVYLKSKSEFGSKIFFYASWKLLILSRTHPTVEEIRRNITNAGLK